MQSDMLTINFDPFQNLETDRLLLRRLELNDADDILKLRSNPETMRYIPRPLMKSKEDALEYIDFLDQYIKNNTAINWAISIKNNPTTIGTIGLFNIKPENYR